MSFNLRTSIANDPCPSGCWEQRKWRVKQLVEKYEPDLIGTQEGAPDQIQFFQDQLSFASTGECAGDCQWNERDNTVLMTGDLNAVPQSSAVQYLANQGPIDGGYTPIPMYDTLTAAGAGGPTWIGSSFGNIPVGSKFDYIFSRRDDHTCLRNGTIVVDTFDGYSSSDHAVLLSEFCLGTKCSRCIAGTPGTFKWASTRIDNPHRSSRYTPNAVEMVLIKPMLLGAVVLPSLATAFPIQTQQESAASTQLKVMSFNVRTSLANDKCPSGCWEQRKWRAKQLVEKYQPDLIGTQEGAPDQIEFFTSNMSFASLGECAGECKWNERNSIFYKPERWEVLENTTFALSDTPEVLGSNTWDLEYLRAAVIARLRDRSSNRVVCILNTHYDITRGQNQSSVLVTERMSEYCQDGDAVFMTGDLNAIPTTAAVKYLANEMPLNGSYTPIPMYDSLTAAGAGNATWIGNGFGNHTWEPYKFDYIFTRDDPETCLQGASVLVDLFDGFSSSDHAVPISEFCLGWQCSNCIGREESKQGVQVQLGLSMSV
ncbi:Endonuclease/exonuclease/phosphatase [Phytophthora cactorum]|nr:Endonuclease/exonuclease/phosphatase [Phytophthora cactorum]